MMRNTSNRRHLSDAREKAGLDVAIAPLGLPKKLGLGAQNRRA